MWLYFLHLRINNCFFFNLLEFSWIEGVFDGHGGAQVSKYIKQTLYSNFLQLMPENKNKWNDKTVYSGLKGAVKKVDFDVTRIRKWNHQGSTLAAVYINRKRNRKKKSSIKNTGDDDKNYINYDESDDNNDDCNYSILTVNLGDSRIVLARGLRAIDLTTDHKPNMRLVKNTIMKKWNSRDCNFKYYYCYHLFFPPL